MMPDRVRLRPEPRLQQVDVQLCRVGFHDGGYIIQTGNDFLLNRSYPYYLVAVEDRLHSDISAHAEERHEDGGDEILID
jgi:hypothetical protein